MAYPTAGTTRQPDPDIVGTLVTGDPHFVAQHRKLLQLDRIAAAMREAGFAVFAHAFVKSNFCSGGLNVEVSTHGQATDVIEWFVKRYDVLPTRTAAPVRGDIQCLSHWSVSIRGHLYTLRLWKETLL